MSRSTTVNRSKFISTRTNIAEDIKSSSIKMLNQFVADLALITKQAHWNLRGA